jgi:hypothetical protein
MNASKIILDLCGGTGSWSKPYKDAGYDIRLITLPDYDVRSYEPPEDVYGILAAPPCTEFSPLKYGKDKSQLLMNIDTYEPDVSILNACLKIIEKCNPVFYAIENPCGLMRKYMGKPQLSFQPYQYGDGWTKKTDIWGKFFIPEISHTWETCSKLDLYIRPGRKKPSIAFLHKSAISFIPQFAGMNVNSDAEFRAITPPGFAQAFFIKNQ